jgi:hypothetical protein
MVGFDKFFQTFLFDINKTINLRLVKKRRKILSDNNKFLHLNQSRISYL